MSLLRPDEDPVRKDLCLAPWARPTIASKRWFARRLGTTANRPGLHHPVAPAGMPGLVRIAETRRGVAATTDCNGRMSTWSPAQKRRSPWRKAARELVASGLPLAVPKTS